MNDKGSICISTNNLINSAKYNTSLETMDLIEENTEIVLIIPNGTTTNHIIDLKEFIRMNLRKGGIFKNPYTRNDVEFSEDDTKKLLEMRKQLLKTLKTLPHQIFIKFVQVLEKTEEKNVQLVYFPEIAKIFQLLLGIMPFFEQLEELVGESDENVSEMIKEVENKIDTTVTTFANELEDEEKVKQNAEYIGFLTIPDHLKETIIFLFHELVIILKKLADLNIEFNYKEEILGIFLLLDDVYYFLTNTYQEITITNNEELDIRIACLLCKASDNVSNLISNIGES